MASSDAPRVLVVGAGQVGVVFGYHLARGGAHVGYLLKPQHLEDARAGFTLYPLNRPRRERWTPVRFPPEAFDCLTTADDTWDYVLLTIPSSAVRGPWFDELARACPRAFFVTFQLGLGDREWLAERVPEERLLSGALSLISYSAPLEDEPVPEQGTASWFPPGSACPFVGTDALAVDRLVRALRKGKLPAIVGHGPAGAAARVPDYVLMVLISALQLCGWKFSELRRHPERTRLAKAAADEANAVLDRRLGTSRPALFSLISPWLLRVGLFLVKPLLPFPLEAFFRVHFTKVGAQMVRDRRLFLEEARRQGLAHAALEELDRRLR